MTVHKRLDETRVHTPELELRRFRVDVLLNETGQYAAYTSRKDLVTEAMARALADGLKRGNHRGRSGGRIVRVRETSVRYGRGKNHTTTVADEDVIETWDKEER